jgi:hypothetical protein
MGDGLIVHIKEHHIVYPGTVRPEMQEKIVDPVFRHMKGGNQIEQAKHKGGGKRDESGKLTVRSLFYGHSNDTSTVSGTWVEYTLRGENAPEEGAN